MSILHTNPREFTLVFLRYERATVSNVGFLNVRSHLATHSEVKAALVKAVTQWVKTTEEGKSLWSYSCNDLNIGDLAGSDAFEDANFIQALAENDVECLNCFLGSTDDAASYDEVLVDSSDLSEEDVGTNPQQNGG